MLTKKIHINDLVSVSIAVRKQQGQKQVGEYLIACEYITEGTRGRNLGQELEQQSWRNAVMTSSSWLALPDFLYNLGSPI